MRNIELLDCTLRDGGYLNDWEFGHDNLVNIFERLVSAKADIIEIGFLDERRDFDLNRSIMPDTASVEKIYGGLDRGGSMVVGMIDYGTCGLSHIQPCKDSFLDGIRVIFKKHLRWEAIAFCKELKALGYQVFSQAVSITSYTDEEFADLLNLVNDLEPFAMSLVDTYGLLYEKGLLHYFKQADKMLKPGIGLGYHAHNNFQLGYANCISVLAQETKRKVIVDGTLYGMGKSAGNAPLELLATYLNENFGKDYQISQMLEAIDVTILDIYKKMHWGYSFTFFLSASNACHPNYVTYLQNKKKLSIKSINEILSSIAEEKKLMYDGGYIEDLYREYQKKDCDDEKARTELRGQLGNRRILLIGPGKSIQTQKDRIKKCIQEKQPLIISINFIPDDFSCDYVFMSNAKRYVQMSTMLSHRASHIKTIATSNVTSTRTFDYVLRYQDLLDEEALIADNPMLMLLKLLKEYRAEEIYLAGFDGYSVMEEPNYINPNMEYSYSTEVAQDINQDVISSMKKLKLTMPVIFVTDSYYESPFLA